MIIRSNQLFTNANPTSKFGSFLQFPLVRIIIAFLFIFPVFILYRLFRDFIVLPSPEVFRSYIQYFGAIFSFLFLIFTYSLYVKYIEKRKAHELLLRHSWNEFGKGFLITAVLVFIVVTILYILGNYQIDEWNSNKLIVIDLFMKFLMGALIEEILFRLIVFKLTEELLGTWIAFGIQVLFFGFSHGLNENATIFTSFAVVIIGGVLYTAAFMYTRRLWIVLGLHTGWNFLQSGVFGMPNSGSPYKGLIIPNIQGKGWITGGSFGIEASYIAILLCLIVGVYFIMQAIKANQIVQPVWIRKRSNILQN
ncbi:CPBP family intramembrane glutamic endopeptidase [Bacteroidota bacterium]